MRYFVVLVWSKRFYEGIELTGYKTKRSAERRLKRVVADDRGCLKSWGILKGNLEER